MKKSLLFCGVAALALASCTQNEVLEVNDSRAIGFNAFVNNNTRAEAIEINKASLKQFNVYGYHGENTPDYTNTLVHGSVSNGWTIDGVAYWKTNEAYEFAAYSDGNNSIANNKVSFAGKKLTITDYTVGSNDLIAAQTSVATQTDISNYPTTVGFNFNHLLSKIQFSFKNSDTRDYIMKISNLSINANKTGNVSYSIVDSNPIVEWTSSSVGEYIIPDIDDIADGQLNVPIATESIFMMPQNNDNLVVTFTVTLSDANEGQIAKGNFKAPLDIDLDSPNSEWTPGYRYIYTATINGDQVPVDPETPDVKPVKIQFSVDAVNTWDYSGVNVPEEKVEVLDPQS